MENNQNCDIGELIKERDFTKLIPLAGTDAFTVGKIHETVINEMAFIDFMFGLFRYENYDELNHLIVNDLNFTVELINNVDCDEITLIMLLDCKHPFLATYAETLLKNRYVI